MYHRKIQCFLKNCELPDLSLYDIMKAERGIASLLANSDWSNKKMNKLYVHFIMKAERGIASLLGNSDWSNKKMNKLYVHFIMKAERGIACLQILTGAIRKGTKDGGDYDNWRN